MIRIGLITLTWILSTCVSVQAATYHVSKSGSDANSCATAQSTTLANAKLTISDGLTCLSAAGDTLLIRVGTYTEQIQGSQFVVSGTSWSNAMTVSAWPGEVVTLRPSSSNGNVVRFPTGQTRSYIVFNQLILDGINVGGQANGAVFYSEDSDHIRLTNCELVNGDGNGILGIGTALEFIDLNVHGNGLYTGYLISNGAYIDLCTDCLISGGSYWDNEAFGVRVYASAGTSGATTIRNIRAYQNGVSRGLNGTSIAPVGGGIVVGDDNKTVINNLVYLNSTGIAGYTDASGTKIHNNTIYDNDAEGLWMQFYATFPELRNNIVRLNGTDFIDYSGSNTLHSSNLTADPSFVSAGGADFRLQSVSIARETGVTVTSTTSDFIGTARPQGYAYDVGAYEYLPVTYFTMACGLGGASYPLCGFNSEDTTNYGTYINRTRVATACPDGTDAVHFETIPVGTHTQFNYGWHSGTLAGWNPVDGEQFYLKYRVRPNAAINWAGNAPESVFYQKFVIFDADIDSQRFITDFRDDGASNTAAMRSQLNVGGGPNAALTLGAWNAVIQGYTLATSASANNGTLRTWVAASGAFTFGSPTSTNGSLDLEDNAGRTGFGLGRFTQGTTAIGGSFGYDICNVTLTDTFDVNWPTVAPGVSPTKYRFRFRVEWGWAGGVLAYAYVASRLRVRRQQGEL